MSIEDTFDLEAVVASLRALGIDLDAPAHPASGATATEAHDEFVAGDSELSGGALSDQEWAVIAPLLPDEAAQAHAEPNRAFVDAVLWLFAGKKHWTRISGGRGEAVRRRYARWAHAGIWQSLHAHPGVRQLTPQRQALFAAMARRAEQLCAKQAGRRRP